MKRSIIWMWTTFWRCFTLLQIGLVLENVQISYDRFLNNFRPLPPNDGTLKV